MSGAKLGSTDTSLVGKPAIWAMNCFVHCALSGPLDPKSAASARLLVVCVVATGRAKAAGLGSKQALTVHQVKSPRRVGVCSVAHTPGIFARLVVDCVDFSKGRRNQIRIAAF